MKKLLLSTTAIGLFAAGSALAEGPTVKVGGYADFQVGSGDQASVYTQVDDGTYSRDLHTRTDTELHINVDGKTDSGLGYGAYIELEADVNADDNTAAANNKAERTYIYVESGFGRVEAGATGDAGDALRVDAGTIARATGGIAGDFYHYVNLRGDAEAANTNYYILPGLPTASGLLGNAGDGDISARATANKLSYYSPRIQGLQAGLSYTPDQDERGTAAGFSGGHDTSLENVLNVGLNYQTQLNDVTIEAAVTGETGDKENTAAAIATTDGLEAYALGLSAGYQGFTLAGSYGSVDEFGNTITDNTSASYWTLGGAYEFGPFATSLTYLASEVENEDGTNDAEFSNLSVGVDYQLAPGLVPYAEVSFFDTDNNIADTSTTSDNDGTVFLVGTQLSF